MLSTQSKQDGKEIRVLPEANLVPASIACFVEL